MADGNVQVVESAYEAFRRGDIDAVLGSLADDVDWNVTEVLPQGGHWSGRDDVGAGFFGKLANAWQDLSIDVQDIVASGDKVCAIGRGEGKNEGTDAWFGFVHVWTLGDGKVTHFAEYADPAPALYG
jgi:uncharacterized protein